jgi:hypothetical protein
MSATPPEAKTEYSRATERSPAVSDQLHELTGGRSAQRRSAWSTSVLAGGLLGALLLVVAEFTTLYDVNTTLSRTPYKSIGTGPNHAYALIPIALLAVVLSLGGGRHRSRPALLALGALGIVTLLIALVGDLPDANASGELSHAGHYVTAGSSPQTGLYLETLAAAVLVMTCGLGLLLGGPPPRPTASRRPRQASAS